MSNGRPHEPPPFPWHVAYLTVTTASIGLLVGVRSLFPEVVYSFEFAPAGFIVGAFTVTSLLHWYDVTDDWSGRRRW